MEQVVTDAVGDHPAPPLTVEPAPSRTPPGPVGRLPRRNRGGRSDPQGKGEKYPYSPTPQTTMLQQGDGTAGILTAPARGNSERAAKIFQQYARVAAFP